MSDDATVAQVFDLLGRNYVEDDDEMFRWDPVDAARSPAWPALGCTTPERARAA